MAGYGYSDGGYSDGGYVHGYQASTYYSPFPNAARLLDGPGSSAYVGAPHAGSFAYEYGNGAVSVSSFDFGSNYYERYRSYSYHGAGGSRTTAYSYEDYGNKTPGGFQGTGGYYTNYPTDLGQIEARSSYSVTTTAYNGSYTDTTLTSKGSYVTSYGYTVSSYERETTEDVSGHQVAGAGYFYESTAVSDAYGYTSYSGHASTF